MYRLPHDAWLTLAQTVVVGHEAAWGPAGYDVERRTVTVGESIGYAVRRLGWWQLEWKVNEVHFELRASVVSLEELLAIAAEVRPL